MAHAGIMGNRRGATFDRVIQRTRLPRRDNRLVAVRRIEPGETIGAHRGEIVVCVPVYRGHEQFVACLDSILAHTPARSGS